MLSSDALHRSSVEFQGRTHARAKLVRELVDAYQDGTVSDDLLSQGWEAVRRHLLDRGAAEQLHAAKIEQLHSTQVERLCRERLQIRTELQQAIDALQQATEALNASRVPRRRDRLRRRLQTWLPPR